MKEISHAEVMNILGGWERQKKKSCGARVQLQLHDFLKEWQCDDLPGRPIAALFRRGWHLAFVSPWSNVLAG